MIEIYVDGTFYNGMYGGGYVVYEDGKIIYQDCGIGKNDPELLSMRNISGEMTAAMRATIGYIRIISKVLLFMII